MTAANVLMEVLETDRRMMYDGDAIAWMGEGFYIRTRELFWNVWVMPDSLEVLTDAAVNGNRWKFVTEDRIYSETF